jgi:hypothetical protein
VEHGPSQWRCEFKVVTNESRGLRGLKLFFRTALFTLQLKRNADINAGIEGIGDAEMERRVKITRSKGKYRRDDDPFERHQQSNM